MGVKTDFHKIVTKWQDWEKVYQATAWCEQQWPRSYNGPVWGVRHSPGYPEAQQWWFTNECDLMMFLMVWS